jgi:hypothetical protein
MYVCVIDKIDINVDTQHYESDNEVKEVGEKAQYILFRTYDVLQTWRS